MGCSEMKYDYAGRDLVKVAAVNASDGVTASFAPDSAAYADEDVFSPLLLIPVGGTSCGTTNAAGTGLIHELILTATVPSGTVPTPAVDVWLINQTTLPSLNALNAAFDLTEGELAPANLIERVSIVAGDWISVDTLNARARKSLGQNAINFISDAYQIGAFMVAQGAVTFPALSSVTLSLIIARD